MPQVRKTDLIPNAAPRGSMKLEEWIDDKGQTRYRFVADPFHRISMETLRNVAEELSKHGRLGTACRLNSVSIQTIKRKIKEIPEFGEMIAQAYEAYKDRLIEHHQNLVFEGTKRVTYDKAGNVVGEEQIYPIRLIELELKKHDEGYRDKKEVNMNVKGGVMVAPAEVSIEEWEQKFGVGEVVEGVAEEVFSGPEDDQGEDTDDQ